MQEDFRNTMKIQTDNTHCRARVQQSITGSHNVYLRLLVQYMLDEARHFCAKSFLQYQLKKKIWNHIQHMWSPVYLAPPDLLVVE